VKERNKPKKGRTLPASFYLESDVVLVAKRLLGKFLVTNIDGIRTGGMIVETEAYAGVTDRASHAFGNRRTKRTEVMYAKGGVAYVYLCYGMYALTNVVTHSRDVPHAVLIRGLQPAEGIAGMLKRSGKSKIAPRFTAGPGLLSRALGILPSHSGLPLSGPKLVLEDRGVVVAEDEIVASPRVGVDYAGEDARLPWRFRILGNYWTSPAS